MKKTPWPETARELYRPSDCRLSAKLCQLLRIEGATWSAWRIPTAVCSVYCTGVVRVRGYRSKGSGYDSRRYQIFWEVLGLERGPLSPVSTIEELLERKSSGYGLENLEYGRSEPLRWPRGTLYPQKWAVTSPTSSGRSVSTVRSRTLATEFIFFF
jgi:hypothetical protein